MKIAQFYAILEFTKGGERMAFKKAQRITLSDLDTARLVGVEAGAELFTSGAPVVL